MSREPARGDFPGREEKSERFHPLIELARGFAPQGAGPAPQPQQTLVLVSTDILGYYGGTAESMRAAIRPPILLNSANDVVRVHGIDIHPGFNFAVEVVRA